MEVVDGNVGQELKRVICSGHGGLGVVSMWVSRLPGKVCRVGREEMTAETSGSRDGQRKRNLERKW